MIGTIVAGSTAIFLAGTATLEVVDGLIDRRRSQQLSQRKPAPVATLSRTQAKLATVRASNAAEDLRKAA